MSLILKNASLLFGKDLAYVAEGYLEIGKDGIIKKAKRGPYHRGDYKKANNNTIFDAEGFLIIPGLINAHTHIGDSLGKDVAVDSGLDARVHPAHGAKQKILQRSKPDHLKTFIRSSALSMMKKGITTFADFREGGAEGVKLLRDAISGLPIKCIVFGRAEYYFDITSSATGAGQRNLPSSALQMTSDVLEISDGLGISGANENSDETLQQYRNLVRARNTSATKDKKKLLTAIHAAESENTVEFSKSHTGKTEVARIMKCLKPDIVIHMTHATEKDISMVARNRTGILVCPRANGIVGAGVPRVAKMLDLGCIIGIGSDNVMLNSPDILRELDYIWKVSRAVERFFLSARDILKMATVNNAEILRLNSGYIQSGRAADIIFIDKSHVDLYPIHDPFAAIVQRATEASIKAVMIDGRFVDGAQFEFANNN
ncbi:MAG TPA: amidohydrolase family protein [Candidatus Nitrosopolaris rasttigaisensis]|jgi:cytosine/adenosine deaminase-related metal-dependent hydrolase|nr:amidohydrolase family protein [Candidatus Nitrosopolaris rasttigaisensis]